jgi:mono/diheme cytochrome c family protein
MRSAKGAVFLFSASLALGATHASDVSADAGFDGFLRLAQAEDAGATAPASGGSAAAALWTKNCASCHGAGGKADTKTGKLLKVRDLTDPTVRAGFDRERMIKATKEGVKKEGSDKLAMKGFADKLSDAEIASLIDLIYSFGQ